MAILGKTKQDVVNAFRTAEILVAARKVFAEKGFNDATMDDVADAGGLSKGTIYSYFTSKRELYLAALRQGLEELTEMSDARMKAASGVQEKFKAFIRTRIEYLETHADFFRIYHSEFGNITHPHIVCDDFRVVLERNLASLEAVLRAGMASGELREMPLGAVSAALYEMTRGVMLRRLLVDNRSPLDQDVEALLDLVWRGIGNS